MRHALRLSCRSPPVSGPAQPRVILVTGASSGIGLCSAALFAARGWRVGLVSRSAEGLAAAARLIAQRSPHAMVACAVADVADSEALAAAARAVVAALGPIEVWVNAAGTGRKRCGPPSPALRVSLRRVSILPVHRACGSAGRGMI